MNSIHALRFDPLRVYLWLLCTMVLGGESYVLLTTDKYLPQGMDEMAFCTTMLALTWRPLTSSRMVGMIAGFCFLLGSLYTMLFLRLDPHFGAKAERIVGIMVLMVACMVGAVWTLHRLRRIHS